MVSNPPIVFETFKRREQKYIADGLPDCDEEMKDLIKMLSKLHDVACVFCCAGHYANMTRITINVPGHEDPVQYNDYEKGYILFAVAGQVGFRNLYEFYKRVSERLPTEMMADFSLTINRMVFFPKIQMGMNVPASAPNDYHAVSLEWRIDDEDDSYNYLRAIRQVCEALQLK